MPEEELPVYEVEEVTLEEAILLLANTQPKQPVNLSTQPSEPRPQVMA